MDGLTSLRLNLDQWVRVRKPAGEPAYYARIIRLPLFWSNIYEVQDHSGARFDVYLSEICETFAEHMEKLDIQ